MACEIGVDIYFKYSWRGVTLNIRHRHGSQPPRKDILIIREKDKASINIREKERGEEATRT